MEGDRLHFVAAAKRKVSQSAHTFCNAYLFKSTTLKTRLLELRESFRQDYVLQILAVGKRHAAQRLHSCWKCDLFNCGLRECFLRQHLQAFVQRDFLQPLALRKRPGAYALQARRRAHFINRSFLETPDPDRLELSVVREDNLVEPLAPEERPAPDALDARRNGDTADVSGREPVAANLFESVGECYRAQLL